VPARSTCFDAAVSPTKVPQMHVNTVVGARSAHWS
jgi:hypothetical protein